MTVAAATTRRSQAVSDATGDLRRVHVPLVGSVTIPPPERVAYYTGMGLLAAFGVIEWPLAVVIAAGHVLADQHMSSRLQGLGEAAEAA